MDTKLSETYLILLEVCWPFFCRLWDILTTRCDKLLGFLSGCYSIGKHLDNNTDLLISIYSKYIVYKSIYAWNSEQPILNAMLIKRNKLFPISRFGNIQLKRPWISGCFRFQVYTFVDVHRLKTILHNKTSHVKKRHEPIGIVSCPDPYAMWDATSQ